LANWLIGELILIFILIGELANWRIGELILIFILIGELVNWRIGESVNWSIEKGVIN